MPGMVMVVVLPALLPPLPPVVAAAVVHSSIWDCRASQSVTAATVGRVGGGVGGGGGEVAVAAAEGGDAAALALGDPPFWEGGEEGLRLERREEEEGEGEVWRLWEGDLPPLASLRGEMEEEGEGGERVGDLGEWAPPSPPPAFSSVVDSSTPPTAPSAAAPAASDPVVVVVGSPSIKMVVGGEVMVEMVAVVVCVGGRGEVRPPPPLPPPSVSVPLEAEAASAAAARGALEKLIWMLRSPGAPSTMLPASNPAAMASEMDFESVAKVAAEVEASEAEAEEEEEPP